MIEAIGRSGAAGRTGANSRRVDPARDGASVGGRLPVPIVISRSFGDEAVRDEDAATSPASSAFLAQLVAFDIAGNDTGERRVRRDPELIRARANRTYRATRDLVGSIEAGFIKAVRY